MHWLINALMRYCAVSLRALGPETDIHHLRKTVFYSLERERERIEDKICQTLVLTYPQRLVDFLTAFRRRTGKMERACFVCDLLATADRVYEKWLTITRKSIGSMLCVCDLSRRRISAGYPRARGGLRALESRSMCVGLRTSYKMTAWIYSNGCSRSQMRPAVSRWEGCVMKPIAIRRLHTVCKPRSVRFQLCTRDSQVFSRFSKNAKLQIHGG